MLKKNILLITLTIVFMTNLLGCANSRELKKKEVPIENVETENVKTDMGAIKKWFPNLEGVESTEWEGGSLTEQGSTPGPSDYTYKGIIILDEQSAENYKNQYEWKETTMDVEMNFVDLAEYQNMKWYVSKEMQSDIMAAGLLGEIYFCEKYILFSVCTS